MNFSCTFQQKFGIFLQFNRVLRHLRFLFLTFLHSFSLVITSFKSKKAVYELKYLRRFHYFIVRLMRATPKNIMSDFWKKGKLKNTVSKLTLTIALTQVLETFCRLKSMICLACDLENKH